MEGGRDDGEGREGGRGGFGRQFGTSEGGREGEKVCVCMRVFLERERARPNIFAR
jgi:hypothetical protein